MNQPVKIFVKPKNKKVLVRNPERNRHLKAEGERVVKDAYWHRRIKDGDVVETDAPKKTAKKKIAKKKVAKKSTGNATTNSTKNQE